jgi:Proto-chlorophyllide reductase 57 kD subunit
MKFLCVPCDSPMKLQAVGPPERGSLSVVYACPECGYEMAMLTNPYETQMVQSLGVRIGPDAGAGAPTPAEASAESGSSACPFAGMMATEGGGEARPEQTATAAQVRWTAAAEARLANIPSFVRPMARTGIEKFALEKGLLEVDEQILDAARDFFGM